MLKFDFYAETPDDHISPINATNALIESGLFSGAQLEEIAEHLIAYTKRLRLEEKWAGIDI